VSVTQFLWMVGTIQQYTQIEWPTRFERDCYQLAMRMFMREDALLPRRWLYHEGQLTLLTGGS
jgi:hypothetical protein